MASANTVKIIVPFSPGGMADKVARSVQTSLANGGINSIIDYKLGAGGYVAYNYVAKINSNETVLLIASNGLTDIIDPAVAKYDLSKDFILVKSLGSMPALLMVRKNHPADTFKELTVLAKERPITYGSSGVGSGTHIASALIGEDYNFTHILYKGQSQALIDVLSGQIDFLIESDSIIAPYIQSNKLKPLAVLANSRLKKYPTIPTFKELGVNDYNYTRWLVLVANKTADPNIILQVQKKLSTDTFKKELDELGMVFMPTTPSLLTDNALQFQKIRQHVKFE